MKYDAIVVGAGPAGSSTAYHLAVRGYHVLLVDKHQFPRRKACGDGLSPSALAALEGMGAAHLWNDALKMQGISIVEHRHAVARQIPFKVRDGVPSFGAVLPRHDLDHALCNAAAAAGAELRTGMTVLRTEANDNGFQKVVCDSGDATPVRLSARFAIIAEGSSGRLARAVAPNRNVYQSVGYGVRQYFRGRLHIGAFFEMHIPLTVDDLPIPGYGWLFPAAPDVVNIGIGLATTGRTGSQASRLNVKSVYTQFVRQLLRTGRLEEMEPCSRLIGAPLRMGLAPEDVIVPGALLVGDAAGLVSPLTGEGIAQALASGELAADSIHHALRNGHREARTYPSRLARRFRLNANLRGNLSVLQGMVRLYDWPRRRTPPHKDSTVLTCFKDIVRDHDRIQESDLRAILWRDALNEPALRRAVRAVERRTVKEFADVSSLFGELASRTQKHSFLLPGYPATVLLAAAACAGRLNEETQRIAVASELLVRATLFHVDAPGASENELHRWKPVNVVAVLMGDCAITRIFHVLSECDVRVAKIVGNAIVRQSACSVGHALPPHSDTGPDPGSVLPTTAIAGELPSLTAIALGPDGGRAGEVRSLRFWVQSHMSAVQVLHDLWLDYYGAGPEEDTPLFLARRGQFGFHALAAMRGGVDLQSQMRWFHNEGGDRGALRDTRRAIAGSRAFASAIDEGRRHAGEALDALPQGCATASLRTLTQNVNAALDRIPA